MASIRFWRASLLVLGILAAGCTEPQTATREERVERTQQALSAMLTTDAALIQAERYVDLCDEGPENMVGSVINPDGVDVYDSVEEAEQARWAGGGGGVGIPVAELACTASGYAELQSLLNI